MSIAAKIDDKPYRFADLDALARQLAYYKIEGVEVSVKCPDLSKEEITQVVAMATEHFKDHRKRLGAAVD